SLSSGIPSTAVYFVLPSRIARIAASLMFSGVSKSGSPAASEITSRPRAFRSRAFCVAAMVADGWMRLSASEIKPMTSLLLAGALPNRVKDRAQPKPARAKEQEPRQEGAPRNPTPPRQILKPHHAPARQRQAASE